MGKKGRPTVENAKNKRVNIRLSDGDIYSLKFIQDITGKTKADIFRDGLRNEYEKAMKKYLESI